MAGSGEIFVIGGGVFGLTSALAMARRGLAVTVFEQGALGHGSSGGPVGALTPHMPERWGAFKAFQLSALSSLPDFAAWLHYETGIDTGFDQIGRLTPLLSARDHSRALENAKHARTHWGDAGVFEVHSEPTAAFANWIDLAACPYGLVYDGLSARISPRKYLYALARAFEKLGGRLVLNASVERLDMAARTISVSGQVRSAEKIIVAAGAQSFGLLGLQANGVKGQAARLAVSAPANAPLIYSDGVYVVPHSDGTVAVGSTSEREWADIDTDAKLDDVVARARQCCPCLRDARIIERWAGIRPRAPAQRPMVGAVPGAPSVIVATGGYKIGIGIAHLIAELVTATVLGEEPPIRPPDDFAPEVHIAKLKD